MWNFFNNCMLIKLKMRLWGVKLDAGKRRREEEEK
jgi:hypothetical protein